MADGMDKKPTVYTDDATGLQYLRGSKQVLFETGVVLPRGAFDKHKSGAGKITLSELLESAAAEPQNCNFDYAYAKTTGSLRRKKGGAGIAAGTRAKNKRKKESEEPAVIKQAEADNIKGTEDAIKAKDLEPEQKAKRGEDKFQTKEAERISRGAAEIETTPKDTDIQEAKPEERKKAAAVSGLFSSALFVAAVMAVVGVGSAAMSAYHTALFLFQGGKPFWIASLTGVLFILFSSTAFTAARRFFTDKAKWTGVIFAFAGMAVVTYSAFSTLAVNFNQFKWVDDERTLTAAEGNEALLAHKRLTDGNRETLNEINARIAQLEGEAGYWRTASWRRYDEFQAALHEAQERCATLRQRQIELEAARPELAALAGNSQETIFSLMERLLNIREDAARFFVYAAPACLYDILAPFALSVALLLYDGRRKKAAA